MEITSWDIYWITRLDKVYCFFTVFFILCAISIFIALVIWFQCQMDEDNPLAVPTIKGFLKKTCIGLFTGLLLWVFIPSTKQAAAILVLPKIINNQQLQQIPDKVMQLGLEWLEELKPTKAKETK